MSNPAPSSEFGAIIGRSRYGIVFWCVVVLFISGTYASIYYLVVQPELVFAGKVPHMSAAYRVPDMFMGIARVIFRPAHWADRSIRQRTWDTSDIPTEWGDRQSDLQPRDTIPVLPPPSR